MRSRYAWKQIRRSVERRRLTPLLHRIGQRSGTLVAPGRCMNHLSLRSETRQSQTLTPRLQHAVRLLQLSSLDYVRELHETALRNPFLDADEDNGEAIGDSSSVERPWVGELLSLIHI